MAFPTMIHVLRFARGLAAATAIAISAVHAQTGQLNDTGMTQCLRTGTSGPTACTGASLANDGDLPHQDARYGRDVANPPKVGGGAAGFDFTRICWNGSPEGTASGPNLCTGTLVANTTATASATPATDWACTRDNVTGLLWSLQTQTASWNAATDATYADAGHNTPARCGALADGNRWRMPARRELLGIVHNGLSSGPMIDAAHFPATQIVGYWAAESYAFNVAWAWAVSFSHGGTTVEGRGVVRPVRLVRNAQ